LIAAKESLSAKTKDDSEVILSRDVLELGASSEFANNNFWRTDVAVNDADLEEMMRDEGWQ